MLNGHDKAVNCLVLTEKGQLISSSSDETIKVWDLKTGQCIKTLMTPNRPQPVYGLKYVGNGVLLSCLSNQSIQIWDIEFETCLRTIFGPKNSTRRTVFI